MSALGELCVCRVIKEYKSQDLVLSIGEDGWARVEADNRNVNIVMCVSRKSGIVPKEHLEIGRKAGNLTIHGMDPVMLKSPMSNLTGSTKLEATLTALYADHKMNQLLLANTGCLLSDIATLADGPNARDTIIGAIPAQMRATIENGHFEFDDLWKLPAVTSKVKLGGVYLILYRNIDGKEDQHAVYCGKSINMGNRLIHHQRAKQYKMVIFATFQPTIPNFDQFLRLCEHTSVCLFLSWNRKLLSMPNSLDELKARLSGMLTAKAFYTLASNVFQRTDWHVQDHLGCNWTTPLCEYNKGERGGHAVWTVQSTPNMRVFTRSPRVVQNESLGREHEVEILARCAGNPGGVKLHLPFSTGIEAGMSVYFVCEIMTDGTDHAIPYCRLPTIGGLTNWSTLRSLGIRIVWQAQDGGWKTTWLQCNRFEDITPPKMDGSECVLDAWQRTTLILDALMRVQYTTPLPAWKSTAQVVIVKEIVYDHWNQEVVISDAQPRFLEAPKLVSIDQNEVALRARYPGIIIGIMPENLLGKRLACDMCFIRFYIHGTTKGNDSCCQYPGTLSCARCMVFRRPCTWTVTEKLQSMIERHGWDGLGITGLTGRVDSIGVPLVRDVSSKEDEQGEEEEEF